MPNVFYIHGVKKYFKLKSSQSDCHHYDLGPLGSIAESFKHFILTGLEPIKATDVQMFVV